MYILLFRRLYTKKIINGIIEKQKNIIPTIIIIIVNGLTNNIIIIPNIIQNIIHIMDISILFISIFYNNI
jgi:hypothetical protein